MFRRRCVVRNLAKLVGKHLYQSLFFNKDLRPATLWKKRLRHRCSPVNFAKFLRTRFFTEHLQWLLLKFFSTFPFHTPWNHQKTFSNCLYVHNMGTLAKNHQKTLWSTLVYCWFYKCFKPWSWGNDFLFYIIKNTFFPDNANIFKFPD